jgi:hypothetical protein
LGNEGEAQFVVSKEIKPRPGFEVYVVRLCPHSEFAMGQ